MDPAFAAYGYGLMAGLGGANSVGGNDASSSLTNNVSGIANESTPSHLFEGHQQHPQNIPQDMGQQQQQQQSSNQSIGSIHHHLSTGIHHSHNHGLGHEQSEHNNGNNNNNNNNNNGGTSTSVQIPQGNKNKTTSTLLICRNFIFFKL
jgi:hypothetical protein